MTNRREFLQIGATATAWPLVAQTLESAALDPRPGFAPLSAVVYDTRFPESVAFATRAEALGLTAFGIDADMTRLWFDEIYHRWQRGPAAIAGLTAHGPMFCFAELARDARMRLVFRAEHRLRSSREGHASHAITGPLSMVADALGACRRPASLGATMADVVSRCPEGRCEITTAQVGSVNGADEDALYTWLIAPAVRA